MSDQGYSRPCNDYHSNVCTEKGRAIPGFCRCKVEREEQDSLRARVAELEAEAAQQAEEIGRLHADILRMRGWEATPDGMSDSRKQSEQKSDDNSA